MPRPLRFVPANALVEVTTRTLQGRLLLKPSPELTDIILGIIGKSQDLYKMPIHAFVVLGTHAHFLLSPPSAEKLARFMQFVNADIAKEAGRLPRWRERLWSRRYRSRATWPACPALPRQDRAACALVRRAIANASPSPVPGQRSSAHRERL
jgi:hypothetical protein